MKNNKVYIVIAFGLLATGFTLLVLEKTRVINVYQKPVIAASDQQARPVNDVDYTPQTSPPDPTVNSEKNPSTPQPEPQQNNATVSITRANQDPNTKNLNVGVLIEGLQAGVCKLFLVKDGAEVLTKNAPITTQSGLVTCEGFTVMANEIPSTGTYMLKISAGNSSANQEVQLVK